MSAAGFESPSARSALWTPPSLRFLWALWGAATLGCAALVAAAPALLVLIPFVMAAAVHGPVRPLLIAVGLGSLATAYGASGRLPFLGTLDVSTSTLWGALTWQAALAVGMALVSLVRVRAGANRVRVSTTVHWSLLGIACVVLMARFQNGIPLLLGNEARITGIAAVNPWVGLLSAVAPILAVYVTSPPSRVTRAGQVLLVLLVFGTASRLLLLTVIVGMAATQRVDWAAASRRRRAAMLLIVTAAILAVVQVYSLRTDATAAALYENRASGVGGAAGVVNDLIGPSFQYAARNGLAVHDIASRRELHAPQGFVVGGLANTARFGDDPERWLTGAIGLDTRQVGAVATPMWSGSRLDFGPVMAVLFALVLGGGLALWVVRFPALSIWVAFGVLLASYGSFLVSAQFVLASVGLTVLAWVAAAQGRARRNRHNVTFRGAR